MKKNILLFSLLVAFFTACGDNAKISTNDFKGNCKVIGKAKLDMNRLSEKDREEYKFLGISQIDVIVVKTIDVDEPEIHHISSVGQTYAITANAIKEAKKGEEYYLDVIYYRNNPLGKVREFSPAKK